MSAGIPVSIRPAEQADFGFETQVVIVGAGAAGLVASLAAREGGAEVVVLERDATPTGSTALSSGLVPAAGTRLQSEAGVTDRPEWLADDIRQKAHGLVDNEVVDLLSATIAPTLDWLMQRHAVGLTLVDGFSYPGHRARRMHGPAERSGRHLVADLERAAQACGAELLTSARVDTLFVDADRVAGVRVTRPDGSFEDVGCSALILACCGFAGNRELLSRYLPDMLDAAFLGHAGNEGHAVRWGELLGAELADMQSFQGHGSVAIPHQIGISWALLMSGGFQVNQLGQRFANEHRGYSEGARDVLRQPHAMAFDIFDERCHQVGLAFDHYREAVKAGAVHSRPSLDELAQALGLPVEPFLKTAGEVSQFAAGQATDPLGRNFTTQPALKPPFYGIRITGGLYHTQGGLAVDTRARVRRPDGTVFPNLWAAGGAARGISGPADWGYLAGNGLMTAIGFGRLAGTDAAQVALRA